MLITCIIRIPFSPNQQHCKVSCKFVQYRETSKISRDTRTFIFSQFLVLCPNIRLREISTFLPIHQNDSVIYVSDIAPYYSSPKYAKNNNNKSNNSSTFLQCLFIGNMQKYSSSFVQCLYIGIICVSCFTVKMSLSSRLGSCLFNHLTAHFRIHQ